MTSIYEIYEMWFEKLNTECRSKSRYAAKKDKQTYSQRTRTRTLTKA